MMRASDFRAAARAALNGNWILAVGTTFLASLLGASVTMGGTSPMVGTTGSGNSANYEQLAEGLPSDLYKYIVAILVAAGSVMAVIGIIRYIVGAFVSLGLIKFNMALIDGEQADFMDLFSMTSLVGKAIWLRIRMAIFTFLWTLLLIIPGIIKSYSYSMSGFVMAENPEITAKEAMTLSIDMMRGNKWRLFCMQISFIGWGILSLLTLGIGFIFLGPYMNAAYAAFYDDISKAYSKVHSGEYTEV